MTDSLFGPFPRCTLSYGTSLNLGPLLCNTGILPILQGCCDYSGRQCFVTHSAQGLAEVALDKYCCDLPVPGITLTSWLPAPVCPSNTPPHGGSKKPHTCPLLPPGLLLRLPILDSPPDAQCYEDQIYWEVSCRLPSGRCPLALKRPLPCLASSGPSCLFPSSPAPLLWGSPLSCGLRPLTLHLLLHPRPPGAWGT